MWPHLKMSLYRCDWAKDFKMGSTWINWGSGHSLVAKSCPTSCDLMDCSPPGSSVHGISQARMLEWVAISFSRGSSQPRDWTWVSHIAGDPLLLQVDSLPTEPPWKPWISWVDPKSTDTCHFERQVKNTEKKMTMWIWRQKWGLGHIKPRNAWRDYHKLEEVKKDSPQEPSEGTWPCWHLSFDFWSPDLWETKFLLF